MPPKHEANVQVEMFDDGIPHPSSDWAIEPRRLEPGIMAVRMLFSDSMKSRWHANSDKLGVCAARRVLSTRIIGSVTGTGTALDD